MSKKIILMSFVVTIFAFFAEVREARAQTDDLKFEAGGQFTLLSVVRSDRTTEPGFGGRFGYNATHNIAFEAEINFFPRHGTTTNFTAGGRVTEGLFGVKAGKRFSRVGIFGKVRPGFISFDDALLTRDFSTGSLADFRTGRITHFATDIGGVLEFYPSRRTIIRFDLGDTIARYGKQTITFNNGSGVQTFTNPTSTIYSIQFNSGFGFRF